MSEYQYYEFQAMDRPLSEEDRQTLRSLSSRARITASSFVNSYEWGDFKGNPMKLMERCFDLHLYLANWGSRRFMLRLPTSLVDPQDLASCLNEVEEVTVRRSGDNLILDICRDEVEPEDWDDDGSGWLAALAPLRAEMLSGDQRMLYLLWLLAVEAEALPDDTPEPLPGLAPLSASLEALGNFLAIDPDLIAAAAERPAEPPISSKISRDIIAALPEAEKTSLLIRLHDGDSHIRPALLSLVREKLPSEKGPPRRTVGELRARSISLFLARQQEAARRAEVKRQSEKAAAEKALRARLDALDKRGTAAWQEVENEIERRNQAGYDRAAALLIDLQTLAKEQNKAEQFQCRLNDIRERHSRKGQFITRLARFGD